MYSLGQVNLFKLWCKQEKNGITPEKSHFLHSVSISSNHFQRESPPKMTFLLQKDSRKVILKYKVRLNACATYRKSG